MERLSTGLVNAINVTGCVKDIMANGVIHIYSGPQPASANDAETGTLLLKITLDAGNFTPVTGTNGLNMGLSVDGVLSKAAGESWRGIGLAAAGIGTTAGYFRWYDINETTGASTTAVRLDGSIGATTAYELQLVNRIIVQDGPCTITTFNYTTLMS